MLDIPDTGARLAEEERRIVLGALADRWLAFFFVLTPAVLAWHAAGDDESSRRFAFQLAFFACMLLWAYARHRVLDLLGLRIVEGLEPCRLLRRLGLPAMLFLTALPNFLATYVFMTCIGFDLLPPALVAAGVTALVLPVEWILGRPKAPPEPVTYSFMRGSRDTTGGTYER